MNDDIVTYGSTVQYDAHFALELNFSSVLLYLICININTLILTRKCKGCFCIIEKCYLYGFPQSCIFGNVLNCGKYRIIETVALPLELLLITLVHISVVIVMHFKSFLTISELVFIYESFLNIIMMNEENT